MKEKTRTRDRLNTEHCRHTGRAREITPIFEMISAGISNFQGKIAVGRGKAGRGCGLKGKMRGEAQGLKQLSYILHQMECKKG